MYIVLDLEFYHNKKREQLGPIKQLGAFKFNDDYKVIDIFEMTVTQYTTQEMLKALFTSFVSDVETIYLWAKNNDLKALNHILIDPMDNFQIVDVQNYFKDVNLASLSTISEALSFEAEGRHNALVDAEYTFEVIKHFDLNNEASRKAIKNYINLIRSNEVNQNFKKQQKPNNLQPKQAVELSTKSNYKMIQPGTMRKLNEDYYQIVNERAINSIISDVIENKYAICVDGQLKLDGELAHLIQADADIVFSNTPRFKSIASKYEDKLIVIVDDAKITNYLAVFVSKKAYKKFIK